MDGNRKGNSTNVTPIKDTATSAMPSEEHQFPVHIYKAVQSRLKTDSEMNHQILQVMPPSSSTYSVKVSSSNPVLILSPKEPALPAVNLNVNTESTTQKTVTRNQFIKSSHPASILKPRAVKVPITVQMPLQEKVTNITFYKNSPKPIAMSNFSGKKVGGTLIFNSKKLNALRSDFKTVISKNGTSRNISMVTLKTCPLSVLGTTTARPIGVSNNCRITKTISVIPNINPNILAHRPNILRASLPSKVGHISKILATGLKRPATSSPQLTNIGEHLLLTSGANSFNGYISKIVQSQVHNRAGHEVSESGDGSSASHITVEKVVPVNIK